MNYAKNILETIGNTPLVKLNKVLGEDFPALVNSIVKVKEAYEPNPTNANRYLEKYEIYKHLYPALKQCIYKN